VKNFFFKLILFFFSFFIPLFLVEFYLILNQKSPNYEIYKYKVNGVTYTFNDKPELYFNDDTSEKIIFLGDSFTFGKVCAGEKKDFVNLLKKKYKKKNNIKIFNFASRSRGPSDYLNIYKNFQQNEKNLKKLIVVLNHNDISLNVTDCKTIEVLNRLNLFPIIKKCKKTLETKKDRFSGTLIKSLDNFLEKTLTWQFIRTKLYSFSFLRKYYGSSNIDDLYKDNQSIEFINYLNLLSRIQLEAKKDGVSLEFIYFNDVHYLKDDNPKSWTSFNIYANKVGIKIHDSWDYFMQHKEADNMAWSLTDHHPNCKAHEIMANYLIENNLVVR
tara:strand:+ start:351 stop:1334 length:984 start_codon:yes stop_codon:yes gene_type:complete